MKKYFVFLSSLFLVGTVFATQPINLSVSKQIVERYVSSGEYLHDIQTVDQAATQYVLQQVKDNAAKKQPARLALVFDIDETSLSNYPSMLNASFGGTQAEIEQTMLTTSLLAIQPTLQLFNVAKQHGVAVFFITGRREPDRKATIENLKSAGYKNWDGLYLKPVNYHQASAMPYKTDARHQITDKGYTIILSLGDQASDLMGGYAEKGFLLPNPFYIVP